MALLFVTSSPPTRTRPESDALKARDRVDQLRLAVAVHPGEPDDLAAPDLERESPHLRDPAVVGHMQVVDLEQRRGRRRRALLHAQQHLAADHQPREALLGRTRSRQRLDLLAAAQDGDPVGDLGHLVQLVADEDDRHALARQRPEDLEQLLRLLRREHRSRLVEDEDVGVPVERLQDLDPLLLADRDVLDARGRVDPELERVGEIAHPLCGRVVVEQHLLAGRLVREDDVLRHRHHRDQHEVLVHHPDPGLDRVAGRAHPRRRALDSNLSLLGRVEPVEDVHQRRLARPVLAEERVNLAPPEVEADVVVGNDAREALRDPAELENN